MKHIGQFGLLTIWRTGIHLLACGMQAASAGGLSAALLGGAVVAAERAASAWVFAAIDVRRTCLTVREREAGYRFGAYRML